MLIGGIVQIIESAKMDPVSSLGIGCGVARVVLCELSVLIGWFFTLIGSGICGLGATKTKPKTIEDVLARRARYIRRP